VCRREFVVPEHGWHHLPKNLFVDKLLAMSAVDVESQSATKRCCDVCTAGQLANNAAAASEHK